MSRRWIYQGGSGGSRSPSARHRAATAAAPMGLREHQAVGLPPSPPPASHGADCRVGALLQRLARACVAPPLEGGALAHRRPVLPFPRAASPRPCTSQQLLRSTWRPAVDARSAKRATSERPAAKRHSLMGRTGGVPPA